MACAHPRHGGGYKGITRKCKTMRRYEAHWRFRFLSIGKAGEKQTPRQRTGSYCNWSARAGSQTQIAPKVKQSRRQGGFGGLISPNKAPSLPKFKYETLYINSFCVQAPLHKRSSSPEQTFKIPAQMQRPPIEDFLTTVLDPNEDLNNPRATFRRWGQWRYLNLTKNSFYILFPAESSVSYRQTISSRFYIRLKGTRSLAGGALLNTSE